MGIDFLDIIFRIEKAFAAKIPRGVLHADVAVLSRRPGRRGRLDFTVGGLHEQVCTELARGGYTVPPDSWERVRQCVSDALGVPVEAVRPESLLVSELGAA